MATPKPTSSRRPESASAEAASGETTGASEIEKILNDAKFVELLDREGLELDGEDTEKAKLHYEAFKKKEQTSRALKEVYSKEIAADTKGQVKLGAAGEAAIDKYLEKLVAEDPDKLLGMLATVEQFSSLAEAVGIQEKEIAEFGKNKAEVEAEIKKTQKDYLVKTRMFNKKQDELRKSGGLDKAWAFLRSMRSDSVVDIADAKIKIEQLKQKREAFTDLEEIKKDLNDIREELFVSGDLAKLVAEGASKQIQEYFAKDPSEFSLEQLENSLEAIEHLQDLDDDYETPKLDYLKDMKAANSPGETPQGRKDWLDKAFVTKMKDTIVNEFVKGVPTLDRVTKAMETFAEKRKGLGSYKGLAPQEILKRLISEMLGDGTTVERLPAGKRTIFKQMAKKLKVV